MKLHYDGEGSLNRVTAGPTLTPADLEDLQRKVAEELLADAGSLVGRVVFFTQLPVDGWFRYRKDFQILAVPSEAPRPPYLLADHPLILEFQFRSTPNAIVAVIRRAVRERQLELLLNAFLSPGVHRLRSAARGRWVLAPREADEPLPVIFAQEMYTWEGLNVVGKDLSSPGDRPAMSLASPDEYYNRLGLSYKHVLDLPSNLGEVMDRFFALAEADRERFLRACFWFQQGSRAQSASVRFTAIISAVETLMPPTTTSPRCRECGRSKGPGTTKQFASFVDSFAPWIPAEERSRLYGLRSALSHGGTLLHSDRATLLGGLEPSAVKEWFARDIALRLVRAVLLGWLLKNA